MAATNMPFRTYINPSTPPPSPHQTPTTARRHNISSTLLQNPTAVTALKFSKTLTTNMTNNFNSLAPPLDRPYACHGCHIHPYVPSNVPIYVLGDMNMAHDYPSNKPPPCPPN